MTEFEIAGLSNNPSRFDPIPLRNGPGSSSEPVGDPQPKVVAKTATQKTSMV